MTTGFRRRACALLLVAGSVLRPLAGQSDSLPVTFQVGASGFVLSQLAEPVDPFYHASALLHGIVIARIGTNVEVPLRVLSETWNFSQAYGATFTSVRPAIRVAFRRGKGKDAVVDSVTLLAGDLWRVRHGEGLALDHFESQGATLGVYAGPWGLEGRLIGFGWAGPDDLYGVSLTYRQRVAIRLLDDSPDLPVYFGSRILSADTRLALPPAGELYAELARNTDARRWGALVGLRRRMVRGKARLTASVEYRHYDRNFFRNAANGGVSYPYYVSLTALDKPLHNFHLYQQHRGRHDVLAARVRGRVYLHSWFADADVEVVGGTLDDLAYEASVGLEANPRVDLRTGALNKFFQFPRPAEGMFRTQGTPWWFMKVTLAFRRGNVDDVATRR